MRTSNSARGIGLIELIIVCAVIGIMAYLVMKRVTSGPQLGPETRRELAEHGIDTTNYNTVINSTRGVIGDVSKKSSDLLRQSGINIYEE